jgi:hypothetical protein
MPERIFLLGIAFYLYYKIQQMRYCAFSPNFITL